MSACIVDVFSHGAKGAGVSVWEAVLEMYPLHFVLLWGRLVTRSQWQERFFACLTFSWPSSLSYLQQLWDFQHVFPEMLFHKLDSIFFFLIQTIQLLFNYYWTDIQKARSALERGGCRCKEFSINGNYFCHFGDIIKCPWAKQWTQNCYRWRRHYVYRQWSCLWAYMLTLTCQHANDNISNM